MNVENIIQQLGISNPKVEAKANELIRLMKVKLPGGLGKSEICKGAIGVELACRLNKESYDESALHGMSGASNQKIYRAAFATVERVLQLQTSAVTLGELAVQLGGVRLVKSAQRCLDMYKERFLEALPEGRRPYADFSKPSLTGAAFFLTAKKQKFKLDRSKLLQLVRASDTEFKNVTNSMRDLCYSIVGIASEKKDADKVVGNRALLDRCPGAAPPARKAQTSVGGNNIGAPPVGRQQLLGARQPGMGANPQVIKGRRVLAPKGSALPQRRVQQQQQQQQPRVAAQGSLKRKAGAEPDAVKRGDFPIVSQQGRKRVVVASTPQSVAGAAAIAGTASVESTGGDTKPSSSEPIQAAATSSTSASEVRSGTPGTTPSAASADFDYEQWKQRVLANKKRKQANK